MSIVINFNYIGNDEVDKSNNPDESMNDKLCQCGVCFDCEGDDDEDDYEDNYELSEEEIYRQKFEGMSDEEAYKVELFDHVNNSIEMVINSPETVDCHGLRNQIIFVNGPFSGEFSAKHQRESYNELIAGLVTSGYKVKQVWYEGKQAVRISWE